MIRTELIRPVPTILADHPRIRPDQIAFVDDRRRVTYAELDATTARLAALLSELGIAPGDRALLFGDNSVETVQSYLAVPRAGGVGVCVNPARRRPRWPTSWAIAAPPW
jgi:acyl-CoA synthetase (AMP-forming)/AMP-acid ligase II